MAKKINVSKYMGDMQKKFYPKNREITQEEFDEYKELRKQSLYHTYFVNYYDEEGEFDYFIFHSLTDCNTIDVFSYNEIVRQFKKLRAEERGDSDKIRVEQVIKYNPNNYPKFKK